jgi:hypothetical protein
MGKLGDDYKTARQVDTIPADWKTATQLAVEENISVSAARLYLRELLATGAWETIAFRRLVSNRLTHTPHYRPKPKGKK